MSIFWHVFFTSRERDLRKCKGILPKCIFDSFTLWRDSLMCNMTHLCVTCLIYVWRDSSIGACAHCVEFSHFGTASLQHTSESCKNAKNTQNIQINLNKTSSGNPRSAWDLPKYEGVFKNVHSAQSCVLSSLDVWHDSFICDVCHLVRLAKMRRSLAKMYTWLSHMCYHPLMCDMTPSYVISLIQNIVSFIGLFCKRDL